MKAPAWDMNPVHWTREEIDRVRLNNPSAYVTDVCADFATPEESLYTGSEIDRCTRPAPVNLEPEPGLSYTAAMDPGTRGNSWTIVIVTRRGLKKIVAFIDQRTGSQVEPLSPREVFAEWAPIFRKFGITSIDTDQYMADALRDIAFEFGLFLHYVQIQESRKYLRYLAIKMKMAEREIELPSDTYFRADLQRVKRRPMVSGGFKVILPATPDGRHCDYAPSMMLALSPYIEDAVHTPSTAPTEVYAATAARLKQERFNEVKAKKDPWWKRARVRR